MAILIDRRALIARSYRVVLRLAVFTTAAVVLLAHPTAQAASRSADPLSEVPRHITNIEKGSMTMSENKTSAAGSAEMAAAKTLTTKVLAIGTWTAKATPEAIPPIMPSEAYDTMRLMLAGKIDQWFAKIDGSGAVFMMNVTDPTDA